MELSDFEHAADRLDLDLSDWPKFRHLAILPHGVEMCQGDTYYRRWEPLDPDLPRGGSFWKDHVLDWWWAMDFDSNAAELSNNRLLKEPNQFVGRHFTEAARETCRCLWSVRRDPLKVMAVFTLAWIGAACDRRNGGWLYGLEGEGLISWILEGLRKESYRILGVDAPEWDYRNARHLPCMGDHDWVTSTRRVLTTKGAVYRAIVSDAWDSQTKAVLVSLTPDPGFDPEEYKQKRATRRGLIQVYKREQERLREQEWQRREEGRRKKDEAIAQAWEQERARRKRNVESYGAIGVDFGDGSPMTLEAAAKRIGVSKATLRRWAMEEGFSVEQMAALKAQGPRRGKDLEARLVELGLIPGVTS